jgi:hypothetical protein
MGVGLGILGLVYKGQALEEEGNLLNFDIYAYAFLHRAHFGFN